MPHQQAQEHALFGAMLSHQRYTIKNVSVGNMQIACIPSSCPYTQEYTRESSRNDEVMRWYSTIYSPKRQAISRNCVIMQDAAQEPRKLQNHKSAAG